MVYIFTSLKANASTGLQAVHIKPKLMKLQRVILCFSHSYYEYIPLFTFTYNFS